MERRKERGRKNMRVRAITSTPISKRKEWSRGEQRALTRERSTERWLKECSLGQR